MDRRGRMVIRILMLVAELISPAEWVQQVSSLANTLNVNLQAENVSE